ncbi:hypothetical protein O181_091801 [Austropuccinia psidii MF-1]|uniref:Uncharacterized protein n=1 Tax=Austropuccinia psidii MF-1 TaxID=1389203 RepID=A0A9Q3IY51_9BASI|nr:hypothetical protein [Austropuccinia psidii MF-1]
MVHSDTCIRIGIQDISPFFHRSNSCYIRRRMESKTPSRYTEERLDEIHPPASNSNLMLDKVKHHAKQTMNEAFDYAKQKWDKSHKLPDFKVGDLVLVSTLNCNNMKGPKKLKDSYVGPFVIVALHGTNAVQVELSGES